jgi:hypothetical protein
VHVLLGIGALSIAPLVWSFMIWMPGRSHDGRLPPPTAAEIRLAAALRADVETLAVRIGERSVWKPEGLAAAADHIDTALRAAGLAVTRLACNSHGHPGENIEATLAGDGRTDDVIVVGAHYDSVRGTVGANDNASGVAALLALAPALATPPSARTIRLVAFANEEPPWFQGEAMGSLTYARACRARGDRITAMVSLETIGFYSDIDGSQNYPFPFAFFYPSRGNFIAFVGNLGSAFLVRDAIATFRGTTAFPSQGGALPGWIRGVGWSDHWAFWQAGYPAFMITDTAPFRYPHYHTQQDTPDKIDYERMARVVGGIERVVRRLAE